MECPTCGEHFSSLEGFDSHRVGQYLQTGPSEYADRLKRGLVSPDENWTPELGRRCLSAEEMREKGLELNEVGRWHDPAKTKRTREAFSELALTA